MYCIGIDPGKHTGLAVWDTDQRRFVSLSTVPIHAALRTVYQLAGESPGGVRVYFEDARQRNWLPPSRTESDYRGHLMGAGSVKRDSAIWEDALRDWGIPFEMVPPRGGMTKWTAASFARITGWEGRTSNHARDAALLVFGRT